MSTTDRAGFENAINEYQNRLSNIKQDELQSYAKRVAESDKPLEELKSVVGEVTSPLALDFLKEGIMHHMGVASAQIKKGGAALRNDLEKQFNDRLSQLKTKAQGVLDEQRGRLQGALDEARGRAQGAVDEARGAVDQVRGNATEAFANARDQANALNPTNTNPNATNDEQGNSAQQRVADDEDEDEDEDEDGAEDEDEDEDGAEDEEPAGFGDDEDEDGAEDEEPAGFGDDEDEDGAEEPTGEALPESVDVDSLQTDQDLREARDAIKDRYNNLTDEAKQRVSSKYSEDEGVVKQGEGEGEEGELGLDDYKINLGTMQENVEAEEKAGNIKSPAAQADDEDDELPDANAPTQVDDEDDEEEVEGFGDDADAAAETGLGDEADEEEGGVQQRVAQIEQQGDQIRADQQLPTGQRQVQTQGDDDTQDRPPSGDDEEDDEEDDAGRGEGEDEEEEEVEGFGDDADAAAETGGLGAGLGEDAAIAAGTGAETGGIGFLVAGVLGIAATLGSIFAPHHDPKPPTNIGPVAAPTQTVGVR